MWQNMAQRKWVKEHPTQLDLYITQWDIKRDSKTCVWTTFGRCWIAVKAEILIVTWCIAVNVSPGINIGMNLHIWSCIMMVIVVIVSIFHKVSCIVNWEKKTKGIYLASKCNLQQLLSFYLLLLSQQYKVRKAVLWDSQFYRYFVLGLQIPNMLSSLQVFLYLYNASVLYVLFSSGCSSDKFIIWWAGVSQRILSR